MHSSLQFLALLLILSYTAVPSAAQIKTASCGYFLDPHCDNGQTITFTGSNFEHVSGEFKLSSNPLILIKVTSSTDTSLSGSIEYNTTVIPDGLYAVAIPSNETDGSIWSGTILFGKLYGFKGSLFFAGTPPTDAYVVGESKNTKVFDGFPLSITGKFNPSKKYDVVFYSDDVTEDVSSVITCKSTKPTDSVLSCTIDGTAPLNQTFHFLVHDLTVNNYVTMKNSMGNLTFEDPYPTKLPAISGANGSCADDSAECLDGANITFNVYDFAEYAPDGYHVNIENFKGAECVVLNTTSTSLTCTLHGVNNTKGMFTMTVQIREVSGALKPTKRLLGTLVLGERKGHSGISTDYIDPNGGNTPSNGPSSKSTNSTVTTILTIIFAILFGITFVGLLIILIRFKLINRSTWSTIKKQMQSSQVEEMRPRAAMHLKGEPTDYESPDKEKK